MAVNSTLSFTLCFAVFLIISAAAIASQQTTTLNLTQPTEADYPKTLNEIRGFVTGKEILYGIPMMKEPAAAKKNFIVVKLLAKTRQNTDITFLVAINKTNLYVSGYADVITRKAYLLDDYKDEKLSDVFEDIGRTLTKVELFYGSSYFALAKVSNITRLDVRGSLYEFRRTMMDIAGEDFSRKTSDFKKQATFLLYATQVISEATRFTYIQEIFRTELGAKLDDKVVSLENEWSTISKAVKKAAVVGDGKLQPAVVLKHSDGSRWELHTVADVKPLVAILLYVKLNQY